jgi:hypothetical protein
MTGDRLQAAWQYTGAELWRPLFAQFTDAHPELPVEIVRTLLVRLLIDRGGCVSRSRRLITQ